MKRVPFDKSYRERQKRRDLSLTVVQTSMGILVGALTITIIFWLLGWSPIGPMFIMVLASIGLLVGIFLGRPSKTFPPDLS